MSRVSFSDEFFIKWLISKKEKKEKRERKEKKERNVLLPLLGRFKQ